MARTRRSNRAAAMGTRSGAALDRRTHGAALAAPGNRERQTRQKPNLKLTPARARFSVNPTLTGIGAPANARQAGETQVTGSLPRLTWRYSTLAVQLSAK